MSQTASTVTGQSGGANHLVLIDDDDGFAELLIERLNSPSLADYRLSRASSPEQAEALCRSDPADLVLLGLPAAGGGLQLLENCRAQLPEVPVVVVAAAGDDALAMEAVKAGAQDYLLKDRSCGFMLQRVLEHAQERHRLQRIARLAHFDGLTGLATRSLFRDRAATALARARRNKHLVAFLYMDLDGFKPINDTYGHDVGDEVLKEIARRLHESMRATDTAARFGGDEMVVIAESLASRADAERVASKLHQALVLPVNVGTQTLDVGVSMGVALFPEDADSMEALLSLADSAMYDAKKNGGGIRFHPPEAAPGAAR